MAREKFPSDEIDRIMVRFPAGMRDRIARAAQANGRSMNSEIVARLQQSLTTPTPESGMLTPEGLDAMRSYADMTMRMLAELKTATSDAERVALSLLPGLQALQDERERPSPKDTKGEGE